MPECIISEDELDVLQLKLQHKDTWRTRSEWFWFRGLLEEIAELALSLMGLHHDPPEWELRQVAAIAMNWLELRRARKK